MSAEIVAIGPFKRHLVSYYEYPAEMYANTSEGAPMVRHLFLLSEGSGASRELAARIGISDTWDFDQHKIDPAKIDLAGLAAFLDTLHDREEYIEDLEALAAFAKEGYDLYFMPNG